MLSAVTRAAPLLALLLLSGCDRQPAEYRLLPSPARAIIGLDNSHVLVAAWIARYHGAAGAQLTDRQLVEAMRAHAGFFSCPTCPDPTGWDLEGGLRKFFAERGQPDVQTRELYLYPRLGAEPVSFEDYVAAIDAGRPVAITFSYYEPDRTDPRIARLRSHRSFSAAGIGYVRHRGHDYFVCHHGLIDSLVDDIDAIDRVAPESLGLGDIDGPWHQPGTSIHRWDGDYTNLTMVFFRPEPEQPTDADSTPGP